MGLPDSPTKIWGKSVKGFLSFNNLLIYTIHGLTVVFHVHESWNYLKLGLLSQTETFQPLGCRHLGICHLGSRLWENIWCHTFSLTKLLLSFKNYAVIRMLLQRRHYVELLRYFSLHSWFSATQIFFLTNHSISHFHN